MSETREVSKPHINRDVEILRHAIYRGHAVDSEKFDWQPADTALTNLIEQLKAAHEALRRIADAPARKDNFDEILIAQRSLSNPASEPKEVA